MPICTDKKWLKTRSKHMTGFCNEYGKPGQHEGTKPKSFKGTPMMTCPMWDTCPCQCHYDIDQLFAMTGRTRTAEIPNPEYTTPVSEFVIPTEAMVRADNGAFRPERVSAPVNGERVMLDDVTPTAASLATRVTPTGRAARGGLEARVHEALEALGGTPTPKDVAEWIVEKYKIATPSSGAIRAVWLRWVDIGFCEIAMKPLRFVRFVPEDHSWEALDRAKTTKKRQAKSAEREARHAIRPPKSKR